MIRKRSIVEKFLVYNEKKGDFITCLVQVNKNGGICSILVETEEEETKKKKVLPIGGTVLSDFQGRQLADETVDRQLFNALYTCINE